MKKNTIGFWRRLAALWIDVFVIYSITKVMIVLLSLIEFRISFGTLFILIGALYSTIMLSSQRQTIGKMLLQIIVTVKTNEPINLRYILLREVFGKWGITVSIPMMLGLILLDNNWLPTVFDILIMIPVIVLCIIYYLFTKQMWYENMAGLTVKRVFFPKKIRFGFFALIVAAVLGVGINLTEYIILGRIPCWMAAFQNINSTRPYVAFLKKQNTNPVDYVIGLFDKYDVVVLCERAHPEMTQWDFIHDVVRDPRFIDKVGHIFTEYGHVGMQDYMNKFMLTDSLSENGIHDHVIHIMRNMPVWPAWTNFNLYQYLQRLYHLNQTLPPDKRIQHHFTDAAMDWSAIRTKEDYKKYEKKYLWNRDEIMAGTIIKEMNRLSRTANKPAKCLVIMNYRHAMDLTDRLLNVKRNNTYEFLKDSFGNRSANVLINTRFLVSVPIASGVWDAAFEKTGNKPSGFNFAGSPFGACNFDLFPINILFSPFMGNKSNANISLRYRDVYIGFVFTHPVKDQYFINTIPGYFDGFEEEYIRRSACISDEYKEGARNFIQSLKHGSADTIERQVDFKIETIIELIFYCFASIGLIIALVAFIFRPRKMIVEDIN